LQTGNDIPVDAYGNPDYSDYQDLIDDYALEVFEIGLNTYDMKQTILK